MQNHKPNNLLFALQLTSTRLVLALMLCLSFAAAQAKPTIEDYGQLPKLRSVKISPDGSHYAFIQRTGDSDTFVIVSAATGEVVGGNKIAGWKARYVYFVNNNYVVLRTTKTDHEAYYLDKFEKGAAFVYDIKRKKIKALLKNTPKLNLHPAQSGMGRIVGINENKHLVYMPAYEEKRNSPYNLYRVGLKTGDAKLHMEGNQYTIDWFVDNDGNVLAREDYDDRRQLHRIFAYDGKDRKMIYENEDPIRRVNISAISRDGKHLIYSKFSKISKLALADGAITDFDTGVEGYDLDWINADVNRKIEAISYSGIHPFDVVVEPVAAQNFRSIEATFPDSRVDFVEAIDGGKKLLVRVSGNNAAGAYMLFDSVKKSIGELGRRYPNISKSEIGQVTTISYTARDGIKIPSVLTWPVGVSAKQHKSKMPLIVLPHGGPASYNGIGFDWWAQYLASQGYLVLQPNFRGSSGFGLKHEELGDGKWGREMQDDVTDGVLALIKAGYADSQRVCIMGASYGGYSALAGGAFSPELYKCVIAVGAVSDVPRMLQGERYDRGENSWVVRYWSKVAGNIKTEIDKLKDISPVNFAENFTAPTLLIHGKDDTVVPISQSTVMHKALKKADKNTTLIELKGEDHWLSTSEARLEMLKSIDLFLKQHNPA